MGKKVSAKDVTRLKAQQMREQQAKKDNRARSTIFGSVAILVIAAIVAVIWVIDGAKQDAELSSVGGEAKSITVSAKGVGVADPEVPTLTNYFDYSCHACANIDVMIGQQLWDAVDAGEINLELVPVNVVQMPWHFAMAQAGYLVSENEPEKFEEFHRSSFEFFQSQFNAGDGSVIQDEAATAAKVKELAQQAGVSADLIAKFDAEGALEVLAANTTAWADAEVEGREGLGTPEFVANGKALKFDGNTPEELAASIISGAKGE
ncbi:MAG: thioredoxin domain-containing protein [Actinomycetaceae bacterium]|nr:thioredoxin domain-containing protein [Actinomycetaceae bacterium]